MKNKSLLRKIGFIGLGALTFVLAVCAVVYFRPKYKYTNFSKASENETIEIDYFYQNSPEMISEGEVFDLKLIFSKSRIENWFTGKQHFVMLSIVKKVDNDLMLSGYIEYYSNGTLVGTSRITRQPYSWLKPRHIYYSIHRDYIFSVFPSEVAVAKGSSIDFIIDEVRVLFDYDLGKETHILVYNYELSKVLINNELERYFSDETISEEEYKLLEWKMLEYSDTLLKNDFSEWENEITIYIDAFKNDSNPFKSKVFEEFHPLLFSADNAEKWMTPEEYYRYMDLLEETNAIFKNDIEMN